MRIRFRLAALAAVPALVLAAGIATAGAASAASHAPMNLSFQTYGDATTGYLPRQAGIQDTLPDAGSAVVMTVHHFSATLPTPSNAPYMHWTTDPSNLGPPRWIIEVSTADEGSGFLWDTLGGDQWSSVSLADSFSGSYTNVYNTLTAKGEVTVTGVFIVNDVNGYGTWTFDAISYNGVSLLGNPASG